MDKIKESGTSQFALVREANKHYHFFNSSRGIIFAPTAKEAKRLAMLYDSAERLLHILKESHLYGGGVLDLERAELINKLK